MSSMFPKFNYNILCSYPRNNKHLLVLQSDGHKDGCIGYLDWILNLSIKIKPCFHVPRNVLLVVNRTAQNSMFPSVWSQHQNTIRFARLCRRGRIKTSTPLSDILKPSQDSTLASNQQRNYGNWSVLILLVKAQAYIP